MKKKNVIFALVMALATLSLSSCDDDEVIADTLWGVWRGDMYVTDYYNGQSYRSSYSIIEFDKDEYSYASGTGYWVDYFSNAPWDYYASPIEWTVNNGTLFIYSTYDDTYFTVYNYRLSDNYFTGEIESEDGTLQEFSMRKTDSPYWDDYTWGYGSYYGYAKPQIGAKANTTAAEGKHVRRIVAAEK